MSTFEYNPPPFPPDPETDVIGASYKSQAQPNALGNLSDWIARNYKPQTIVLDPETDVIGASYKSQAQPNALGNLSDWIARNYSSPNQQAYDTSDQVEKAYNSSTKSRELDNNAFNNAHPFKTDIINANIEAFKRTVKEQALEPGKVNQMILVQAGLNAFNNGINVVNPLVITGAIPPEGILTVALGQPQIGYTQTVLQIDGPGKDPNDNILGLSRIQLAAQQNMILGQEAGMHFSGIKTIGDLIDKGVNAVTNLFKSAIVNKDSINYLGAADASFDTRLGYNTLNPNATPDSQAAYKTLYQSGATINGIDVDSISQGFAPINEDSSGFQNLANDSDAILTLEDAFNSNAIIDRSQIFDSNGTVTVLSDPSPSALSETEPSLSNNGLTTKYVFPFYMQSLNTLADSSEKYITFQATFNGINEGYTPQWSKKTYFGRNTSPRTYSETDREISFNFTIFASNRFALSLVKQRVNWLVKNTYPKYTSLDSKGTIKVIDEAPVIAITIGDMWKNLPGVITSLKLDWDMSGNNRWELSNGAIALQAVNVSMTFAIIYDKFMYNGDVAVGDDIQSSDFYEFVNKNNVLRDRVSQNNILSGILPGVTDMSNAEQQAQLDAGGQFSGASQYNGGL